MDLWPKGAPNSNGDNKDKAELTVYLPDAKKATGRAVVCCPGGGYAHLAMDHEGHQWANFFNNQGIALIVLKYRMPHGNRFIPISDAEEAVKIARLAREAGCGEFIKIEVIHDSKYLLPDNYETAKACEMLAKDGFIPMPYMYPDLYAARDMVNAGAAAIMPLAAPIGSNQGLSTKQFIRILIEEIDLPVIVDAGIGKPSQACEAMEMGAAAIMANTAIATAGNIVEMAKAFRHAIIAGRTAYLAGTGRVLDRASASSPLTGFIQD